uniref:Uncharacterized protein n=1 Tax=Strigamia maritima TaxID=126957 RepID=T1IQ35_STRMM
MAYCMDENSGIDNQAFERADCDMRNQLPPHSLDGAAAAANQTREVDSANPDASSRIQSEGESVSSANETREPADACVCRWPCRLSRPNVSNRRKSRPGGGRGFAPRAVASLLARRDAASGSRDTNGGQQQTRNSSNNNRSWNNTTEISPVHMSSNTVLNPELLPDILNSHLPPPPYSTLPPADRRQNGGGGRGTNYTPEDEPKHCCGVVVSQTVSIRWFIVMIAFVGLCCAVVGTVLGALKTTGREHLTVSLLMIGVGIVLITVSGIAWRLTSTDAPSCRMMLGLRSNEDPEPNNRFVPRIPPSYGRSHHPYAAMMYPEFQFRPPPPSYQASMQEYRLRLLLLDRQHTPSAMSMSPVSPPPTYRSHTSGRQPLSITRDSDCSRPPSYRSRTSSVVPRSRDLSTPSSTAANEIRTRVHHGSHSRDPSLSLSCLSHESLFEVHPLATAEICVGLPMDPSRAHEDEELLLQSKKDNNSVTIVQSTESSRIVNPDTVIVTVPGISASSSITVQGEVEILAHL